MTSFLYATLFFPFAYNYPSKINFYNTQNDPISPKEAKNLSTFVIKFDADKKYKLQLVNNTLNLSNIKSDICSYSAKVFDEPSYGVFDICSLRGKIYTKDKYIEIADSIRIKEQSNEIESDHVKNEIRSDNKFMKIFIINDRKRIKQYGANVNNDTMEIYEIAKNIIEREDWGKYTLKLVLNGIANIIDGEYENVNNGESIISKKLQNLIEDGINSVKDSEIDKVAKDSVNHLKTTNNHITASNKHEIEADIKINNYDDINDNSIILAPKTNFLSINKPALRLIIKDKGISTKKDPNLLDSETEEKLRKFSTIPKDKRKIYGYKLKPHVSLGFSHIKSLNDILENKEFEASKDLKRFADMFEKIKYDLKDNNDAFAKSNLIILFTTKEDETNLEGMTFIGGACSTNDSFSIIKLKPNDSTFYHGKVLAHEILHSLNARHDNECGEGYLMEQQGCTTCMEDNRHISKCTKKQVIQFIEQQDQNCFKLSSLCGNGIIDDGEECDSGLPFGSDCCTSDCKLRRECECDDRNNGCCKDCKILPRGTTCQGTNLEIDNSCIIKYFCDGISPKCQVKYKKDGEKCTNGFCKNGFCQNRDVFCERINRKHESTCEVANQCKLICTDERDKCSMMGLINNDMEEPLYLPDGMVCALNNVLGKCASGQCLIDEKQSKYFIPLAFLLTVLIASILIILFMM